MSKPHLLALPLASLTAVGLLASDLYLPALPSMGADLAASIPAMQATMALFMIALALSQLVWGWAADHFGDRLTILAGTALLAGGSLLCALAPGIDPMLAGRLVQGLGAGAATVAVPALIRRRFSETDAVGALAMVAMAESVIPALGPAVGAAIVLYAGWRVTFWVVAVMSVALMPLAARIVGGSMIRPTPVQAPADAIAAGADSDGAGTGADVDAGRSAMLAYVPLLRNGPFMRYALSYALMFGALLMFVASAPVIVTHSMGLSIRAFAVLQICGVAAFMLGATTAMRKVKHTGTAPLLRWGAWMQIASGVLMTVLALQGDIGLAPLVVLWALFCSGLGVRGPSTMGGALQAAGEHAGKGAGLTMFLAFAAVALATMAAAPLLHLGLLPAASLLLALSAASKLLLR
jgi:DHA1 family bicyclomycin/chloramphenicol resistance-like MFS transporter